MLGRQRAPLLEAILRTRALASLDGDVVVADEDLVFELVQLCASATGKPLTDDELRLIGGYPNQLALLYPGQLS